MNARLEFRLGKAFACLAPLDIGLRCGEIFNNPCEAVQVAVEGQDAAGSIVVLLAASSGRHRIGGAESQICFSRTL